MRRTFWLLLLCIFLRLVANGFAQNAGELKWKYKSTQPLQNTIAIGDDGVIYVLADNDYETGFLAAVDPGGTLKWTEPFKWPGFEGPPTIGQDGTIYMGNYENNFKALNSDGTLWWDFMGGDQSFTGSPAIGRDGTLYIPTWSRKLYALALDGTLKWEHESQQPLRFAPTIGTDGTIYYVSEYDDLVAVNPQGDLKWKQNELKNYLHSPVIHNNGSLVLVTSGGLLRVLGTDGSLLWQYNPPGSKISLPIIDIDGSIIIGSNDNNLYALHPDGSLKWTRPTPGAFLQGLLLGEDQTIYGKHNNRVYAVDSNGAIDWTFEIGDAIDDALSLDDDGTLYFCGLDSALYAIQTNSMGLANSIWPKRYQDVYNRGCAEITGSPVVDIPNDTLYLKPFETAILDGSHAVDPDGDPLTYKWSLLKHPEGGAVAYTDSNAAVTRVMFTEKVYGTYVFGLHVTDHKNGASGDNVVIVYEPLNWTHQLPAESNLSMAMNTDGIMYVACDDSALYAVNADGTLTWRFATEGAILSEPVVGIDETVFVGCDDGYLYAIDFTGNLKWKYDGGYKAMYSPMVHPDSTIFVAFNDRFFHALHPDGTLKWNYRTNSTISAAPVFDGDSTIYFGTNHLYAMRINGTLNWRFDIAGPAQTTPAISSDGTVYICNDYNVLYAINDNAIEWTYQADDTVYSSPVLDAEGCLYFGDLAGTVYALKPNGLLNWKFQTSDDIYASPLVGQDGRIYIGSTDGFLYSLNADGSLNWKYETGAIYTSPVLQENGSLFFQNTDGKLYSILTEAKGLANSPWPAFRQNNMNSGNLYSKPVADFTSNVQLGYEPITVTFTDRSKGYINSWSWDFGDGETSTLKNPVHTFNDAGTFTVKLTVTGPFGTSVQEMKDYIDVIDVSPDVDFVADTTMGVMPFAVRFTSSTSDNIVAWSWNFGDGSTSTEQHPEHEYVTAGVYTVSLTVTDNLGMSETVTKPSYITVAEPKPVAYFSADTTFGQAPFTVQFTDSSTGNITCRSWYFGDGETSAKPAPVHTYTRADTFTVRLSVTGPNGSDVMERENYIIVTEPKPVAAFVADTTCGIAPFTVRFADQSLGKIDRWEWDFGDGAFSAEQNPEHTFTDADSYTVVLHVYGIGGADTLARVHYIAVDNITLADQEVIAPASFNLYQNYPNPFNPTTIISYDVPEIVDITIAVYNIRGERVKTLVSGLRDAGRHSVVWTGVNEAGTPVSTGVYLYSIESARYKAIKKMTFIK